VSDFETDVIARLERIEKALNTKTAKANAEASKGEIANDVDLDGKFGNEPIKRDPSKKYWDGDSFVGKFMNECTAEYLDAMAKYKDACAFMNEKEGNPEKAKYAGYDRRSASRARGWAKRIREGFRAPVSTSDDLFSDGASDPDIPF